MNIINRRIFFQLAGSGVAGYFMSPLKLAGQSAPNYRTQATVLGTAKNVIFILLAGAPSQIDTFDLKVDRWTPADFEPTTIDGMDFPAGLMPNLSYHLDKVALLRSCQSNALVHALLQTWNQIARNPTSATGKIAPNIGSLIALEFEKQRTASQKLPGFISLNTGGNLVRSGYLPGRYSPFDVQPAQNGLTNLINPDGEASFRDRYMVLQALNSAGVPRSEYAEMSDFYDSARTMMYEPSVNDVFRFSAEDRARYGSSAFGDSCIVARNLVRANLGTRYIQINLGGWDNHQNIYQAGNGIYRPARQLDSGLANLLADLSTIRAASGRTLLDETLVVAKGEFGRTVGNITGQAGRDHYFVHSTLFAGGGVRGGRALGKTTADGRFVEDTGWSHGRPVGPEDIAATIYSAAGIDYSTIRRDDPLGRGFEYVPSTGDWPVYPVLELFQ